MCQDNCKTCGKSSCARWTPGPASDPFNDIAISLAPITEGPHIIIAPPKACWFFPIPRIEIRRCRAKAMRKQ